MEVRLLFLTTLAVTDPFGIVGGMLLGISAVPVLASLMMKVTYQLNIQKFFRSASVILVIFASGILGYSGYEFIEADLLPPIIEQ